MIFKKIEEINEFLEKRLWVDFCFEKIGDNYLKIVGSIDFSWGENIIEIEFIDCVYANILLNTWTKPDNHVFIRIQEKDNCSFVEKKISNEYKKIVLYADNDFCSIIYAKDINYKIL